MTYHQILDNSIVSGGQDKVAYLWDIRKGNLGSLSNPLAVGSVTFSLRRVVCGLDDGSITIYTPTKQVSLTGTTV